MEAPPSARPNILFIMADDLGWADLSVYGQSFYRTPNLDLLASSGLRFTNSYANSAVCSATRIALMTGRYQYRLPGGLEEPLSGSGRYKGLPPEHPTLPSLLKDAGYLTALIGKWHLGKLPRFGPMKSGYQRFFGNYGGFVDYFTHKAGTDEHLSPDLFEGETPIERVGYYTDLLADEACSHLRRVHGSSPGQPFLLSLHFTAPHWPWLGPKDEQVSRELTSLFHHDGGNLRVYGDMVVAMDAAVGRVLATLDELQLSRDTIVVFTSDNGGERFSNVWPFTGQKTELLEGGLRVPTLLRWPARLPAGQVSDQVIMTMDWLPTLLAAAGCHAAKVYPPDGDNLLPVLLNQCPPRERTLYWRYKAQRQRAVRSGRWKYLKINENEFLFDLDVDVRERANLRHREPEVFDMLKELWERWNERMLPMHAELYSHHVSPQVQPDRYVPEGCFSYPDLLPPKRQVLKQMEVAQNLHGANKVEHAPDSDDDDGSDLDG
jgi:arylsulfatase A-like enzyme